MKCQRCSSLRGDRAVARIRGEIIDLAVCGQCAREAWELGFNFEPLAETSAAEATRPTATG